MARSALDASHISWRTTVLSQGLAAMRKMGAEQDQAGSSLRGNQLPCHVPCSHDGELFSGHM
jgi:hypothetical protein